MCTKFLRNGKLLTGFNGITKSTLKLVRVPKMSKRNSSDFVPLDLEVNRIVWIDLEMTGLDIERDKIMEVACLITDSDLNIVAEGPEIVVGQPEEVLETMSPWCIKQHGKTGLTEKCKNSKTTVNEADDEIFDFISQHVTEGISPLAGNSVYTDRLFIQKFMPKVNNYLHYRIIDVSTIKELCRRWNPQVYSSAPPKTLQHRALSDIKESVKELKYYRNNFFNVSEAIVTKKLKTT